MSEYVKGWYIREAFPVQVGCITYPTLQRKLKSGEVFRTYEECVRHINPNYKRRRNEDAIYEAHV